MRSDKFQRGVRPSFLCSMFIHCMLMLSVWGLCAPTFVGAQEQAPNKKNEPVSGNKIRSGVIASTGQFQKNAATNLNAAGEAAGDTQSPVSASIHKLKDGRCEVVVSNTTQGDAVSVSYAVEGYTASGSRALYHTYTSTVKPGSPVTKIFSCGKDLNLQVVLKSGRIGTK